VATDYSVQSVQVPSVNSQAGGATVDSVALTDPSGGGTVMVTASADLKASAQELVACEVKINGAAVGNPIGASLAPGQWVPLSLTVAGPGLPGAGATDKVDLFCYDLAGAADVIGPNLVATIVHTAG